MPNGLFSSLDITASAMGAERQRMTVSSENLAHAGDTKAPGQGLPYTRQRVVFEAVLDNHGEKSGEVEATVIQSPRYVQHYEPGHPHADPETGMVTTPDIDPILELTDLMVATRAYDANANAARGLLRMHESALRIGDMG
jgi:flagellar basal-body rod protein FlgC